MLTTKTGQCGTNINRQSSRVRRSRKEGHMGTATPGPWAVGRDHGERSIIAETQSCYITAPANGRHYATFGDLNSEDVSNARLIAAAPDLYQALEAIVKY